jgi:hypothetical protein
MPLPRWSNSIHSIAMDAPEPEPSVPVPQIPQRAGHARSTNTWLLCLDPGAIREATTNVVVENIFRVESAQVNEHAHTPRLCEYAHHPRVACQRIQLRPRYQLP